LNLKDIRNALFSQTDWAPTQSPEAVTRVNDFINRAYNDVCLEAPFLFFESQVKFATQVDAVPKIPADTISVSVLDSTAPMETAAENPWVFEQNVDIGTAGAIVWATDRSWDGRMLEIEVTDPTTNRTVTYRNTIRSVWKKALVGGAFRYRLSVVTPWPYQKMGKGPFKYRIYSDNYYLPDDVVQVKSMRLWHQNRNWPLDVIGQEDAERYSFADSPRVVSHGLPRTIFRREHKQIQGPAVAPDVTLAPNSQLYRWIGPEPAGTFEYVITYCWGKRDTQFRNPTMGYHLGYADTWENDQEGFEGALTDVGQPIKSSQNRFREPLWESAPSPVSVQVVVPPPIGAGVAGPSVQIVLPNIEYMQGFLMTGTQNSNTGLQAFARQNLRESGWHVRIYRRRVTANFANYNLLQTIPPSAPGREDGGAEVTGLQKLDLPTAFFLLAEFRIDDTNEGVFFDNGRIVPDYHRRLRDTHGYQAIKMYPYPDQRYEVDVRCVRRPPKLVDNQDAPLVHAEAIDLIIHRALMFLYENMGNPQMSQLAKGRYDENLLTLSKRYGDLRPPQVPVLRRFSRANTSFGQRGHLKQWWTVKS
tara:strand:+ start:6339 stop:8099 length:1761 start_codon:yes stop_codon:yes gene_type:complete